MLRRSSYSTDFDQMTVPLHNDFLKEINSGIARHGLPIKDSLQCLASTSYGSLSLQ